tara:strand:+ start:274 stop:711 length:438 start_codon:yes stop_codon:yes gene_type:complete
LITLDKAERVAAPELHVHKVKLVVRQFSECELRVRPLTSAWSTVGSTWRMLLHMPCELSIKSTGSLDELVAVVRSVALGNGEAACFAARRDVAYASIAWNEPTRSSCDEILDGWDADRLVGVLATPQHRCVLCTVSSSDLFFLLF